MNRVSKITIVILLVFELVIMSIGLKAFWENRWKDLGLAALSMAALFVPYLINSLGNRMKLKLPRVFSQLVLFYFLTQYFGEIKKFYQTFWWWDLFLHGAFGALAVLFAIYVFNSSLKKRDQQLQKRFAIFIGIISFCFSVTCSSIWEIFEFVSDMILPEKMVKGGLEDTMTDLIMGAMAALITAIAYYFLGKSSGRVKENL